MLIYKLTRIYARLHFIIRFLFWKTLYGKRILFPFFFNSCIDSRATIKIIKGKIVFRGKFFCRSYLLINIFGGTVTIGKDVFFNQNVSINCHGILSIGDYSIVGENVKFYDHNHRFGKYGLIKEQGFTVKDIHVGNNVWLGSNVIILSGVSIGNNSVISAGSIVRNDVPSDMIFKDGQLTKIDYKRHP